MKLMLDFFSILSKIQYNDRLVLNENCKIKYNNLIYNRININSILKDKYINIELKNIFKEEKNILELIKL